MKIVCESCGAKYSIADEKVAGKVFKIRCKKCSAVIVVRGDEIPAESEAEAAAPAAAEDPSAIWYVVVDGEQQGPYSPNQIGELLGAGTADWESYVWRDGFEGWVAAREVPELVNALSPAQAASEPEAAAAVPAAAGSFGEDPFAAPEPAGASPEATGPEPEAPAPSALAGADLFAQASEEPSPFGAPEPAAAAAEVAPAPVAPAPAAPQAIGGASDTDPMTGRRSENSVLFSLSNLQALATGGNQAAAGPSNGASATATAVTASSGSAAATSGGSSGTEGSGLIDIRALASTNGTGAAPAPQSADSIDDLLSIGTGSPLASSLTAPVLGPAEEEKKSGRGMMIMMALMALVVVAAAAAVIVVLLTRPPAPTATGLAPQTISVGTESTTTGDEPATTDTAPTEETAETAAGQEDPPTKAAPEKRPTREERPDRNPRREPSMATASPTTAAMTAPTMTAMTAMTTTSTGMSDINDLINAATMMSGTSMASAAPDPSLPESPSRSQVASALRGVSGQVRACGNGQHGRAMTTVVVAGATGRVQSAQVQGQFAGTPVAACIARAVRGARFPRFRRPTFSVNFPYSL